MKAELLAIGSELLGPLRAETDSLWATARLLDAGIEESARALAALAGVGLLYAFEPQLADELRRGSLRVVLEPYAAAVPGFFLYFPSRAQVSPAFRAFVDVARELAADPRPRAR